MWHMSPLKGLRMAAEGFAAINMTSLTGLLRHTLRWIDIIGNKREDLSFQRKLESRTKHPFEKLDSCLRRNDKQFISNSRYLGFG
jgi:hypothetical protein